MTASLSRRAVVFGFAAAGAAPMFGVRARPGEPPVAMAAAGLKADGSDQRDAIQKLLSAGVKLDGEGETYCVSNTIRLFEGGLLQNATIRYIGPDIGAMFEYGVITAINVADPVVRNVKVDRNSPRDRGEPLVSAAIAMLGCRRPVVERCEVVGDGKGCGVRWQGNAGGRLTDLHVHDITWEDDAATNDVLVGVALSGANSDNLIARVSVENLLGYRKSGFPRGATNFRTKALWTRGISSGTQQQGRGNVMIDCRVSNVDQAYDIPSKYLTVERCSATDCYTWGFKQTHNGDGSSFKDCAATRCGYAGFVFSQSNATESLNVRNIRLVGCRAIDSGTSDCAGSPTTTKTPAGEPALWADPKPSGFLFSGVGDMAPENIEIVGGEANDRYGRMAFAVNNTTASRTIRVNKAFLARGYVRAAAQNVAIAD